MSIHELAKSENPKKKFSLNMTKMANSQSSKR